MSGISSIQNFGIKAIQQKPSNESVEFLMKEGNVAIKYRVMRDICKATDAVEYFKLRQELENSVRAKKTARMFEKPKRVSWSNVTGSRKFPKYVNRYGIYIWDRF